MYTLCLALLCAVLVLAGALIGAWVGQRQTSVLKPIGFWTPIGLPAELEGKIGLAYVRAYKLEPFEASLEIAESGGTELMVDLSHLIERPARPEELSRVVTSAEGVIRTKVLAPASDEPKVLRFLPDREIFDRLRPYLDLIEEYPGVVSTLMLIDEPYLNGVSKAEMERVGRLLRRMLNYRGLGEIRLGVIFSSGMFDPDYAGLVADAANHYAIEIDDYLLRTAMSGTAEEKAHADFLIQNRLTTYDQAGNMIRTGGLPAGFDVVGFDFYLSTLLFDRLHDQSLAWLARNTSVESCSAFKDLTAMQLRQRLSFFSDGPIGDEAQLAEDRRLLGLAFDCRMRGFRERLDRQIQTEARQSPPKVLMLSESSSNGLLEFDPEGQIQDGQPMALVEGRVREEVERALALYKADESAYSAGLLFFTYRNLTDHSIGLGISGAKDLPSVTHLIEEAAQGR